MASIGACHHPPPPSNDPANPPAEVVEEDPDQGVDQADATHEDAERAAEQARIDASARRIIQEVAATRGLPVKGEFGVELISREGVREFVRTVMYEEMTSQEIQLLGRIQASLGVLPVGSDGEQVLLDLYEMIHAGMLELGAPCEGIRPRHEDFRAGDIRHSRADISRARQELGYAPRTSMQQALRRTMKWLSAG